MDPLLSVIICSRNRKVMLSETLNTVLRLPAPEGLAVEVIVVDNNSNDGSYETIRQIDSRKRKLICLQQSTGGKAAALNRALGVSEGQVIIFCDDDVKPRADWLDAISKPILQARCDCVAGEVVLAPHLIRPWMNEMHQAWLASTHFIDPNTPETAIGANMAIHRRVLDKVPQFDEELGPGALGLWEDTLFSLQLRKAGYSLAKVPATIVEHHFEPKRLEQASFISRAKSEARSSAYVAWHWNHTNDRPRRWLIMEYKLRLMLKRLWQRNARGSSEGIAEWHMNLVTGIEYHRHLRRERLRPRNYEQFGLRKLKPLC